jgi:hypothetical protein
MDLSEVRSTLIGRHPAPAENLTIRCVLQRPKLMSSFGGSPSSTANEMRVPAGILKTSDFEVVEIDCECNSTIGADNKPPVPTQNSHCSLRT